MQMLCYQSSTFLSCVKPGLEVFMSDTLPNFISKVHICAESLQAFLSLIYT